VCQEKEEEWVWFQRSRESFSEYRNLKATPQEDSDKKFRFGEEGLS